MSSDVPSTDDPQQRRPPEPQPSPYPGYGSQPSAGPPPGQWGGPYPAYPGGVAPGPPAGSSGNRPGAVVAAAVITMVMSALTAAVWLFFGIFLLAAGDSVVEEFRNRPDFQQMLNDAGWTFDQFREGMSTVGVILLVGGVLMLLAILPAIRVLPRSGAARVILIVLSAITALIGLFFTVTGFFPGLLWVAAGVAVIILLFAGGASAWFAGRSRSGGSVPTW